jgi:hypothetical protein
MHAEKGRFFRGSVLHETASPTQKDRKYGFM